MKKVIALVITLVLIVGFTAGCGAKDRELYAKTKLSKYVELEDYTGIKVDTKSATFEGYYEDIIADDIYNNQFYNHVATGTVKDGDTVNIDYVGKKDGVAFDGGTAEGYDLTIGSNTFIDGFEEGLIDAQIGSTVDLNLTFPKNYQSEELAGADVVFTVKVNFVYQDQTPEEYYRKLSFDTVEDYNADVTERAAKNYLLNKACELATISEYPESEQQKLCDAIYDYYEWAYEEQYGMKISDVLAANGSTEEEYKASILENMVPQMMETQMVMYYILDEEELKLTEDIIKDQGVEQAAIAESYAVQEIVVDFLYENAVIK